MKSLSLTPMLYSNAISFGHNWGSIVAPSEKFPVSFDFSLTAVYDWMGRCLWRTVSKLLSCYLVIYPQKPQRVSLSLLWLTLDFSSFLLCFASVTSSGSCILDGVESCPQLFGVCGTHSVWSVIQCPCKRKQMLYMCKSILLFQSRATS